MRVRFGVARMVVAVSLVGATACSGSPSALPAGSPSPGTVEADGTDGAVDAPSTTETPHAGPRTTTPSPQQQTPPSPQETPPPPRQEPSPSPRQEPSSPDATTSPPEPTARDGDASPFPTHPPPEDGTTAGTTTTAATGLEALEGCDEVDRTRSVMTLGWTPASDVGPQRVGVTTRKDGFDTGTYAVTEALSGQQSTYAIQDLQAGGVYYWRVLTLHDDGWVHSRTASFTAPICVEDSGG